MKRARFGRLFEAMAAVGVVAVMASASRLDRSQRALTPVTHVIEIRDFRFVPETVTVSLGDTIRWVNRDPVPHTATAADSSWDSGRLEPDRAGNLVVRSGSHHRYVCAYHPTMTGVLRFSSRAPRPRHERCSRATLVSCIRSSSPNSQAGHPGWLRGSRFSCL